MKQKNTLRWIWQVAGTKKGYILLLTLTQGVSGAFGVAYALLFRSVVDAAVGKDGAVFRQSAVLLIVLVLVQLAVSAFIRWMSELSRADLENVFKLRLVDNILRKDYASVSAVHTAEWINRITGDTSVLAGGAVDLLPGMTATLVRLFSALVMIIALDPWFAYVLIPGGIVLMIVSYALRKLLKSLHKAIRESDGSLRVYLQEHIGSLMVIKAFSTERQTIAGAAKAMEAHKQARMRSNRFSNIANAGFGLAMNGMYLLGVIYCAGGILTERISYGTLTAVIHLIGQVQGPFSSISGYLPKFYSMLASAERLMEIERFADDVSPAEHAEMRRYYEQELQVLGLRGACFTYRPRNEEETPVVLRNFNLEIRKGEYIAFCGHSGCGKSTVLKLLMSMYSLDSGECYLDSQPLTARHRRLFVYVPQGNALLNGTIREVVSFAEPEAAGDDARLRRALKIACADSFVEDLDTRLGEGGSGLSEGQAQRIAIARAIFADYPILLLDESTSALDELTEKRVLENLRKLTDKTVIIVTHRKAVLSICDRVLQFSEAGVQEAARQESKLV